MTLKPAGRFPIVLAALLSLSLFLLHARAPRVRALLAPLLPRRCPHILLFTQARHGSTWLLDSAERCRFSRAEQVEPGVYGKRVYLDTELWHLYDRAALYNISAPAALRYVSRNCSLKLFPPAIRDRPRVRALLRLAAGVVPVVVLRRDVPDSFRSFEKARATGDWAHVKTRDEIAADGQAAAGDELRGAEYIAWQNDTKAFFEAVETMLAEERVDADSFWYDRIKDKRWLWLRSAKCWIRSCNYR